MQSIQMDTPYPTANITRGAFHPRSEVKRIEEELGLIASSDNKSLLRQNIIKRMEFLWSFLLEDAITPICEKTDVTGFSHQMQHLYKATESFLFQFELLLQQASRISSNLFDEMEEDLSAFQSSIVTKEAQEVLLLSTIFETMSKVVKKNIQAILDILGNCDEEEAQKKILRAITEIRGASIKAQACIFVLFSVMGGEVKKPTQVVWEELLKEAFWNVKLFEQHSQNDLWSQTSQGLKRKEKFRSIMKKAKERREKALGQSLDEEVQKGLKQRDHELYEEWVSYREHLNSGATSERGEKLPR